MERVRTTTTRPMSLRENELSLLWSLTASTTGRMDYRSIFHCLSRHWWYVHYNARLKPVRKENCYFKFSLRLNELKVNFAWKNFERTLPHTSNCHELINISCCFISFNAKNCHFRLFLLVSKRINYVINCWLMEPYFYFNSYKNILLQFPIVSP